MYLYNTYLYNTTQAIPADIYIPTAIYQHYILKDVIFRNQNYFYCKLYFNPMKIGKLLKLNVNAYCFSKCKVFVVT